MTLKHNLSILWNTVIQYTWENPERKNAILNEISAMKEELQQLKVKRGGSGARIYIDDVLGVEQGASEPEVSVEQLQNKGRPQQ